MPLTLRQSILLWQLPFWVLLVGAALVLDSALNDRVVAIRQATQTRAQSEALAGLMQAVTDMETGVRGYVIAGREDFLEPYRAGREQLPQHLADLRSVQSDLPVDAQALSRIEGLVLRWQAEVALPEIQARQAGNTQEAQQLVKRGTGKKLIDQVRREVASLNLQEAKRLQQAEFKAETRLQHLRRAMLVSGVLVMLASILLTVLGASWLSRSLQILVTAARRLGSGGSPAQLRPSGALELRELSVAFNTMSRDLHDARLLSQSRADDLARCNSQMSALSELSDWLRAARSLEEGAGVLARALPTLLPETSGTLFLQREGTYLPLLSWGEGDQSFAAPDCWALRRGEARFPGEGRFAPPCRKGDSDSHEAPYLCFPLFVHGTTLGLLRLGHSVGHEAALLSNKEELRQLLIPLTRQIGLALSALQLQDQLREQSTLDPLTGLANRRLLSQRLAEELSLATRSGKPLAFVAIDIDHFKRLNDTFGHDAGDAVLVHLARTLRAVLPGGALAARPGGEEFCFLLPGMDAEHALRVARRLEVLIGGWSLHHASQSLGEVTVSQGIAVWREELGTAEALIKAADQALYQAKENGRHQISLFPGS